MPEEASTWALRPSGRQATSLTGITSFRPALRCSCNRTSFRLAEGAGDGEPSAVDDLAVVGYHDHLPGPNPDGGEDVAIGVLGLEEDLVAPEIEHAVGANEADGLDPAPSRQAGRGPVALGGWDEIDASGRLLGGGPGVSAIAVVAIVKGLEVARLGGG